MRFADEYQQQFSQIKFCASNVISRGLHICYEKVAVSVPINVNYNAVSVFSCAGHRVVPIKFVLAELCYLLSRRNDAKSIVSYNMSMANYVDDDGRINGAYGWRLRDQLQQLVRRLIADPYTRQACAAIYSADDGVTTTRTHLPCNVFLQALYREKTLILIVTSRSSDFVTGFSIDTLHWQALALLIRNELVQVIGLDIKHVTIEYNIGSLHVYAADKVIVDAWEVPSDSEEYEHFLTFPSLTLSEATARAQTMFKEGLSIHQLGEILCLDMISMGKVVHLNGLFEKYRNKVVR